MTTPHPGGAPRLPGEESEDPRDEPFPNEPTPDEAELPFAGDHLGPEREGFGDRSE